MEQTALEQVNKRAEEERRRLERGEKPRSRFSSKLQRSATRALAAFFALMLALTLVSRAADGITVARVSTDRPKTGILTQRVTVSGSIQPLGDLPLTLPGGITVSSILAKEGQRVKAGDTLLELDLDDLARQRTALEEKLRIVELRLAAASAGTTKTSMDAVLAAQQALADAQTDYDRLVEKLERTEGRSAEDLELVQDDYDRAVADYDKAVADYDKAVVKAKNDLIEAARKEVEAAEKNLAGVKEAAELAIEGAESSLTSARDAQKTYSKPYYDSVSNLEKLRTKLSEARKELQDLQDNGGTEAEIAEAQAKVEELDAAVDAANWNMQSYNYGGDLAVKRAEENLRKVTERQEAKVKEAEDEVQKAKDKLAEQEQKTDMTEESGVVAAQASVDAAQRAVETAQRAVETAKRNAEDGTFSNSDQLFSAKRLVEAAQRTLEDAQRKAEEEQAEALLSDAKSRQQAEIERLGYRAEQRQLQQNLADLRAVEAAGGRLVAPVDGTVQSILAEPGLTQDGVRLAALSRSDGGYAFEGKLDQKEAERLSVGDEATLSYVQEGKSLSGKVVITSIGAADDKGMVTVGADLPAGNYPDGVSANLEVSKRSEQYRMVLPLGALRGNGQDNFVLILREKQTVMGTEQTVVKLSVTVKEQDSQNVAVEGSFLGDEQVVVSSNKPIEEGDRVRLERTEEA